MAAKKAGPASGVSGSMQRFVQAHLPQDGDPAAVERADKSLTVYLSNRELEHVEAVKNRLGLSRQDVLRQMIVSGLEQFNSLTGWWKE